ISFSVIAKLNNPHIYRGISIGDVEVGGMSVEEAGAAVTQRYSDALTKSVTLRCGDAEQVLDLAALGADIDLSKTVNRAFGIARSGNTLQRLEEIKALRKDGLSLPPVIRCDDVALAAALRELAAAVDQPGQDMQLSVGETELTITRGVPGDCINQAKAAEDFKATALTLPDNIFVVELEKVLPTAPNAAAIHSEICGDPVDASYKVENQRLVIIDEKPGVQFDQLAAQKIIDQTPGDVITIPITTTPAKVTASQLKASLFPDLLGSYSSKYNAGDTSRSHNLSLASQKISEVVLAPGDIFSYNGTVGPRTLERGFRTANVYVGNRVEPGVGGGICQVSSTLFNAVVLSDLRIVQRTNHSLPVSYVPLGRDATVSYGSIDFQFSNNTDAPIKIVASASGGVNAVSIYGTKKNKNRTIEISTECTGTTAARLVQKENPDLPAGTVKVEQKGSNGSSYNTYKITKEDGRTVKSELLTKSTYVASDRIEIIGTAPAASPAAETPDTPPAAEPAAETAVPTAGSAEPTADAAPAESEQPAA
ncbi:MAG: VanW family protein, partial [Clostridia bacterium]